MISYYFPPLGGIGSVRALKFAQYLPEFGWDPVVITPRKGAYHADPNLAFDETKVVRTGSLEISRAAKRMIGRGGDDTRAAEVGPALGRLRSFARRWIYRPDAQVGWYPFALGAARRILRERRCDVILSSSFPITAQGEANTSSASGAAAAETASGVPDRRRASSIRLIRQVPSCRYVTYFHSLSVQNT